MSVNTEIKQPLLPVVCPLCKIEEIANQDSESSSLPHAESVSLQFSSVSDYYDRLAKVAQFCCANNAPTARPLVVGNVRAELRNMFLEEDQKGEKRKGGTSAARRVSSKARSGQMPGSASGDPMMVMDSPSSADGATGSERTRVNRISRLTDTTSERSSRRAPAAVCPIQTSTRRVSQSHMAGGGRRGLTPTVRSSQGAGKGIQRGGERPEGAPDGTTYMSVFAAFVNGLVTENPRGTGLRSRWNG